MKTTDLASLREEIEAIDKNIWLLLSKRFALVERVSKIKRDLSIPVYDADREKILLEKIAQSENNQEISLAIRELYKLLFDLSRKYQLFCQSKSDD